MVRRRKIKKEVNTDDEFRERSRNSRENEAKRKLEVWRERLMRRFTKLADDVTPADCGLDFEGYLVTTITSHHKKITKFVTVSLADKHR